MFGPDDVAFLERGTAFIVGTVSADGAPHASRGWGIDVVGESRVRLLLDADDEGALADLAATGAIAVTAADVRTLHSTQLKGRVVSVAPGDETDAARARRFCDQFFTDIRETDNTPYDTLERMVPSSYVVCVVDVEEFFDQTPGPGAGAPVGRAAP